MSLEDYFRPGYRNQWEIEPGGGYGADPYAPDPQTAPAPAPPGGGGPGMSFPTYNLSPYQNQQGAAPGFTPPPDFNAPDFEMPNPEDDPGYQWRLAQGQKALEASAAAKGTLHTGGTLADLIRYGQGFASNEYGNVFDRASRKYENDYRGARAEYDTKYGSAHDVYQSEYNPWQFLSGQDLQSYALWQQWLQSQQQTIAGALP